MQLLHFLLFKVCFPACHAQTRIDPMPNTDTTDFIHASYFYLMEHMLYFKSSPYTRVSAE